MAAGKKAAEKCEVIQEKLAVTSHQPTRLRGLAALNNFLYFTLIG
jgi:hypothetical protein